MENTSEVRLVAIAPYQFLPARFGGHRAIAFFYRFFSRKVDFCCVSVKSNESDVFAEYPQYPILGKTFLRYANFFNVFKIGKVVKKHAATHVMTEHPYLGWLVLFERLFYHTQVVIRSHNIESQRFKTMGKWWWRIMYWYEGIIYRKADAVFFITEEDRQFAVARYRVEEAKSTVITYGFQPPQNYSREWKEKVIKLVRKENELTEETKILFFNGDFSYPPNAQALEILIHEVLPLLKKYLSDFVLIICGKSIPKKIEQLKDPHLILKGFVADVGAYFAAADLFLNPIVIGGGIKTKLVEALSYETKAVSFDSGAIGIPKEIVDGKLSYVADGDAEEFVNAILDQLNNHTAWENSAFRNYFNWERIAAHAAEFLRK